jgi:hypothetical protein
MISYLIILVGSSSISSSKYVLISVCDLSGLYTDNSYKVAKSLLGIISDTPLIATTVSLQSCV